MHDGVGDRREAGADRRERLPPEPLIYASDIVFGRGIDFDGLRNLPRTHISSLT
jgi:hypothetical protein